MRSSFYIKAFCAVLLFFGLHSSVSAQLFYEGLVFDGMGSPLLENISSVTISPDGKFVYTSGFNDDAISVFSRNTFAEPGGLTFLETQKNEVAGVQGLTGVFDIKVSPDGRHLYAAASTDDAVVVFTRNTDTGSLTYLTTYWNNVDGVSGLEGAYFLDLPPDGNHVYVAGPDGNTIVAFQRNVMTGTLNFLQVMEDEVGDVTSMNYPLSFEISPDGKFIYVPSFGDNAVSVFSRNLATGELSFVEEQKEGVGGVTGLLGTYSAQVSPDGKNLYVTGSDASAVVVFDRDVQSGELTYLTTYYDNQGGVDGIAGTQTMAFGMDGDYLYVTGANEDAVAIFSRNATGHLSFLGMVQEGVNSVTGISYPLAILPSSDGMNMYVGGFGSASLAVFDIINGMLSYKETQLNTDGVSGLDGSKGVTVSPDGNHVYVAGDNDDAIVTFSRDAVSGQLTYVQKITDGSSTDGLNGVNAVVVSADGQHVYTTSFWDKAIVLFNRNSTTGELEYIARYKDGISGVDGLNGANSIAISSDGNSVYATGFWEHAVAVFSRNPNTGQLTFVEVFKDGSLGVDGLNRASDVIVSPDGTTVYVAGYNDNAISIFDRNTGTGQLTYVGIVKDGVSGVDGLNKVNSIIVSPDNNQVYATGYNDDALAIFNRAGDGSLTYVGQMKNGVGDVEFLNGPSCVEISPNGEHLYVTSSNDDAIVSFRRDVSDGSLIFEESQVDGTNNVNGLNGALHVAISPEGKHMYAAASVDDAVSIYSCTYLLDMIETICEGDSVVVGASVYRESGLYVDTFSFGACKSVINLKLEVHPLNTLKEIELCNEETYEFNGTTYSETGVYPVNLSSSIGCDSIVTLDIRVVSTFSTTHLSEVICQGEAVEVGGQLYTTSGTYTNELISTGGCDSMVVLDLVVNTVYDQAVDAEICEGDFYVFGTQNYIASGVYTETFTSSTGCDSTVTLNLNVLAPFETVNATICEGEVYEVGTESFNATGTYTVTVQSSAGCESEVTLNLVVNDTPTDNVQAEICQGETYAFEGQVYDETGVYTVTYPAANGCDSVLTLDLIVNLTDVVIDATICEGDSYPMGGQNYTETGTYSANFPNANSCGDSTVTLNLIVEASTAEIVADICQGETYTIGNSTYSNTGTYNEMVTTNAGCETAITLVLTVHEIYDITLDETVCAGETITIGGQTYSTSGTYVNELTAAGDCDSTVTLNLVVLPEINLTGDVTNADNGNDGAVDITVTGGQEPYTFVWSNGAETEDISNLTVGTYTVTITDNNDCVVELSFDVDGIDPTVEVDANFTLTAYPNPVKGGEQLNLLLESTEAQSLRLQLFDVVGKQLRTENLSIGVGTTNHTFDLPQQAGMYLLRLQTPEGNARTLSIVVQ